MEWDFILSKCICHDYPVIMGILIIGAFLTLIGNMIADLVLLKLNPNYEEKKKFIKEKKKKF